MSKLADAWTLLVKYSAIVPELLALVTSVVNAKSAASAGGTTITAVEWSDIGQKFYAIVDELDG